MKKVPAVAFGLNAGEVHLEVAGVVVGGNQDGASADVCGDREMEPHTDAGGLPTEKDARDGPVDVVGGGASGGVDGDFDVFGEAACADEGRIGVVNTGRGAAAKGFGIGGEASNAGVDGGDDGAGREEVVLRECCRRGERRPHPEEPCQ